MLKLYVLIRDDLSTAQQAVQAGHAVAKFGYDYPREFREWQDDNNTLIYLSVYDVDDWATILTDGKFKHSMFYEPDSSSLGGRWPSHTAIAVAPNWFSQYVLFKDLPLALREEPEPKRKWWNRG